MTNFPRTEAGAPGPRPVPVLVPAHGATHHLSGWTGLARGTVIDPLGVECFPDPVDASGLPPVPGGDPESAHVHTLSSQRWTAAEMRDWLLTILATGEVDTDAIDDDYANFNELVEGALHAIRERAMWRADTVTVDGQPVDAKVLDASPSAWAAVVTADDLVVGVLGEGVHRPALGLRWADDDELSALVADAVQR